MRCSCDLYCLLFTSPLQTERGSVQLDTCLLSVYFACSCSIEKAKEGGRFFQPDPQPFVIKDPHTGRRSFLASVQRVKQFRRQDSSLLSREETQDLLERVLKVNSITQ